MVSEAHDPAFSHMNIVATGDEKTIGHILKQLNKLVDVVHATRQHGQGRDPAGARPGEGALPAREARRGAGRRAHLQGPGRGPAERALTVQVTGDSEKVDALHRMLGRYGVIEMVRTGKVIVARGEEVT